jgi:hypothetical protein
MVFVDAPNRSSMFEVPFPASICWNASVFTRSVGAQEEEVALAPVGRMPKARTETITTPERVRADLRRRTEKMDV